MDKQQARTLLSVWRDHAAQDIPAQDLADAFNALGVSAEIVSIVKPKVDGRIRLSDYHKDLHITDDRQSARIRVSCTDDGTEVVDPLQGLVAFNILNAALRHP